jgi:hypothetical protein
MMRIYVHPDPQVGSITEINIETGRVPARQYHTVPVRYLRGSRYLQSKVPLQKKGF